MATRFYLSSTAVPNLSPTPSSTWLVTTGNDYRKATLTKDASAATSKTTAATGAASPRYILNRIYVTDPLDVQTLSTNFIAQIRGMISSTASSTGGTLALKALLVNSAGTVRLSSAVAVSNSTYGTALANRSITTGNGVNLSSIAVAAGDRLVFEVGFYYSTGTNTTRTATNSFGANTTDLPVDNTTTTALDPWIESTQTLLFLNSAKPYNFGYFF